MAFVVLGLSAIAVSGVIASSGASQALRQSAFDRLTAVRETRASELQRYFTNLRSQMLALATDESTLTALEQLNAAWPSIPAAPSDFALRSYYREHGEPDPWFPRDPRTQSTQLAFLVQNPSPEGSKDLLLDAPSLGRFGSIHARFHPTLHRYKTTFGFYDLFLISTEGRVLYTAMKEIDIGVDLDEEPYRSTPIAAVYRRSLHASESEVVMNDYVPYVPSKLAPAAFLATPLHRAGSAEGVLVAQVAIDEVNDVMDGGRRWKQQGLGDTGDVYVLGPDKTLRSDLRLNIENQPAYLDSLRRAHIDRDTIENIRRNRTAVLSYPVDLTLRESEVLRTLAPISIGDLQWTIVAEIENREALAPIAALRQQMLTIGAIVALACFAAAGWLGASVTKPVLAVAEVARRIGRGERRLRIHTASNDEVGQLAADFNRMSDDLERTTVSRDELEVLAGRLITGQEDERRRIARELHDDFTQRLAAAAIEAGRLESRVPAASQDLRALKDQLAMVSHEVHDLSRRLHPRLLDDLGLAAAIENECRASFERGGPIVNLTIDPALRSLSKDAELAIYRITQEALRNMQRHAAASEASLSLGCDDANVELTIHDNGQGFDRTAPDWKRGLGLASMEERVRLLRGRFEVDSQPGRGTTIRVTLPLETTT